jgi:hypothetical protein
MYNELIAFIINNPDKVKEIEEKVARIDYASEKAKNIKMTRNFSRAITIAETFLKNDGN